MLAGRLLGNMEYIELSKAEEPVGRHWTVEIMG